jgi:uncharacterized protein (DUF169 family)
MTSISEYNACGEQLEQLLLLRVSPIAVKMLEREEDIPPEAIRPKRDRGMHIAQCQAFAMSRRDRTTVAMLTEDHWCFAPLVAYGLKPKPDDEDIARFLTFPRFEMGKYIGVLSAPLRSASFEPDVVMVYSNTAQLGRLFWSAEIMGRPVKVNSSFYPPSCGYTIVPVMRDDECLVTLPDPGEFERALAVEGEIILSLPSRLLADMVANLVGVEGMGHGYKTSTLLMKNDFPQPDHYARLFAAWGLDAGRC